MNASQKPQNAVWRANTCSVDLNPTDGIYGPQIGAQRIGGVA